MNNPNNSREKLYTRLKDDGYDLVDFDTFSKKLDEESSRKSLYDQMTSAGYDLGGYDEYTRKIVGSPFKQNNSVAPTPSEKPEEEKAMISAPSASTDEEYITGLGQGAKQETQQIAAGVKYAGGEALDLVTKTAKDNASALAALDKMQAEGKDVAQETKRDAKSVLLPLIGHSAPAIDMVARVFGKKNPIAKANAEVANDKMIRKALEETDGDVEAARALLEQRANEQTTADEWRDEAAQVMNEAKPTKGAGAWVGKMIPQMIGTAAGLGLSAITKSPLPAQILGLGQMGALTASTAGASMKEARDAGATNGEVWATGLADAAIEFATEAIPFKGYLSPLVKQMKSKTGKAIADVIVDKKSPARKELQNLLDKANAQLGGKLFTAESAAKYLDDVLKEGASEFTAEALQTITPMLYAEPENYPTLWEVFSNGIEGLKGGIFMGSVLGGVANAATNKAQRDRRKEQGFVNVAEVKVSEDSDETTIAEVIDYDDQADRASILINGEIMPLENASKNVVNQEVFTFEEFDRGQIDLEHAESYDRGRNIATPQEKNDALNDLEAQEANIRQRYSLDPDVDVYEFMGGDPIAYAMNETDTELRSEILDLVNAKAVYDGMTDGINERIATTIEESDRLIDSHVNKDDNLIHAAILKGVDDNSDRKVYIISGAFARNEDGTIDTTDLAEGASMIVMDATSGKKEFIDPRNLKDIAEAINPAEEKQRAAEAITNEIATKEEAEIAGTLAFVPNDIYTIVDENGVEHTATIVADTQDGNVQVIIDNAQEPMLMPKEKVQQMADAYNIGRANAKMAEKKAQPTVGQSSSVDTPVVENVEPEKVVPMLKNGQPDFNAMDAEMFVNEYASRYGEESATKIARKNISSAREEIAKIDKKIDDITDPNQMQGLFDKKAEAEARLNRYVDILDRMGMSEDANETEADQKTKLRNEAGNKIVSLFPDGLPNVESFILADIATGNRIRWSDKETNGAVTSRGLGAELGLSGSNKERVKRLALISNDAMTPEEYAESLRERLDAAGIRYDESSLRDDVLNVYQSVDTRKGAWEALENIANRANEQEQEIRDWEDAQQRIAYEKAKNAVELPAAPDLATIEEEVPVETGVSFDENINEIENIFNDERSTENTDVSTSVSAEDGIADGDQASIEVVQGAGTDNTLGDRGSIRAGQGSNESNVGEGVADVSSADVFRAEEVDATTPQLSAKEEMRRKPLRARAKMWEAKVGVPVHLIETLEEVPTKDARKAILDGKVVTAWVTDGEVYLYMPYLRNRTEVDKTYIHEVVAHVGMKRLLGKEGYRQFCMRVYNEVMTEADRKFYDAYPNVKDHAQAADEYIAHLSEDTDMESSIWQKVVRIFRDALRVLGIETALTNKDIQDLLRDSYQNLTNEENVSISESEGTQLRSVYHGSGAEFDKFDHLFMGTGEGHQAFGWGTYVTEVEGIGKQYAKMTSKPRLTFKGEFVDSEELNNPWRIIKDLYDSNHGKLRGMRNDAERIANKVEPDNAEMKDLWDNVVRTLSEVRSGDLKITPARYLYSVEIPDNDGTNYLEYGKPLSKTQLNRIKQALYNRLIADTYKGAEQELKEELDDVFAVEKELDGRDIYGTIATYLGSDKAASEFLNENGYVGISYPADGGNAGMARNYVIFNESDLEIKDSTRFRVKEKAPETASVQKEHQPTVVSSADGTKVLKKIDSAIEEYENKSNYPRTLLGDIAKVLNARKQGSNSQYAIFEAKNGKVFTIRLADHNAKVSTFDIHNEKDGISIIITAKSNEGIQNDGDAHIVEYFYDSIKLRKANGKPLVEILKSIKQTLYSGEYKDTTGLAEREEVNIRDGVRFRVVEPTPTFYSNAERAAENVKQEKATPEQWLKMIEKNGGLKAGEDKWLGLSDWLKSSDKKTLTKQEVLDFIKENQIQIEEVEYAENPQGFEELKKEYDGWLRDGGYDYAWDKLIERYGYDSTVAFDDVGGELVVQYGNTASKLLGGEVSTIKSTRLDYTTNGLDNKREIALTVPTIESWNESDEIHFGDAGNGRAIAWVRFGETTDADGNRVLVIDEVQSKRHQEGREKGYQDSKRIKEATQRFNALADEKVALVKEILHENGFAHYTDEDNSLFTEKAQRDAEMGKMGSEEQRKKILDISRAMMEAAKEYNASSGIPEAPFEKNWAELAMKRMLRYAAENGFDKIAWTTGEQQAVRYDISKSVDNIKSEDNNVEETSDGTLIVKNITIYAGGSVHNLFVDANGVVRGREYDGKKLSDIVGKPLAEKLMEQGDFELEGDGLRIGGEGMKAFYDQMIPSFMNKYGKKWGVKVGEVTMPSLEENNAMHSIDVTDAMRESVMQGQPMFRISDYDRQFADLQSEYDALDKNDEKALNEWREKKTSAVRDYLTHIKDRFGMRSELIVFNGADEEQMREAYTKIVASYKAKSNANPPTYEDFKKKSLRKDMVAMYRKNGDTITFNAVADDLNDKMQFAETMFHEDAHRVSYGLYTSDEFETIWKDAKKSKDRVAKVVDRLYGDKDDVTKGKEYIAKAVGYLANKQKDSFMQFMKGEMPVDELLKKLRSNSKIAKLAVEETLNVIKDEYRVQVSRRGDTRRMGGVGYGSDLQDTGVVLQGNGGTEQGGSADRDSRYRVRVLDSTLADMVGEESYNKFLDGVFRDADDSIRREMVNRAMQNGLDFRTATQEYLSNLVNENADSIFLSEVKDLYVGTLEDAGIDMGDISDNELRYALWKNNQKDNGVFSLAEDVVMRSRLGVGNYTQEADTSFRVTEREQIIADAKADGTYLKAPNGKDTNLTPDQWVTVRTDAFKKWFGDWENDPANASQIVDTNGEPKVVWHGGDFAMGDFTPNGAMHFGTFDAAVTRLNDKLYGGEVRVEQNADGEFLWEYEDFDDAGFNLRGDKSFASKEDAYREAFSKLNYLINPYFLNIRNIERTGDAVTDWADVVEASKEDGYDGIVYLNDYEDNGSDSYIAFSPNQIKSAEGNTTFDANNDDIRFRVAPSTPSTGKARQMYDEAVRSHTKKNNVKKSENLWHHLREAYQDSMLSVQKLMEAVLAETGNTLRSSDDVYKAENQLSSKNKAEIEKWERDFMKPLQLEILDLVKKGASYEDIVEYLLAKHGLERNLEFSRREDEEDGKVWDGFVKRDFSGLTELTGEAEHFTEAAQQIVEEFEGKYSTSNLWSKINAATKESLKKSYDSGLMSKETYDKVANMFQYYIPLRGWDNNVAADQYEYMANKGMKILPALKTAKGRTSRADDPIATLGSVGESSIIQGNRNLMKQKFLNFAQNNPTSLLTVDEQWYEQNADGTWKPSNPEIPTDATADEVDAIIKAHEAKMEALGDKATKKRQGLNINLHTTKWEEEEHAVNVKRNGKEYKIYVNGNPIAAQAINGFTNPNANKKDSWEWIEQRATAVKNFMARAFTSMNPAFVLSNLARDIIWAGTSVAIKENADYARQYSKNISNAMLTAQLPKLVSKWKKGTLDMNDPIEKYFHEFITNGGETGFTQLNTVDDYKRNMERFIKEAQGGVTTKAKKGWRWIWDNVEFLNRSAEDTTRFMVYLTSQQMGRPISESIANAKDITVNFNKKGRGTMGANVLGFAYIFFNATIQSLANFGKLIANHPKKTVAALTTFGASGMITPMVALAVQAMLSGDDDEPTYWDLPEWVRRNNIVIYVGGSGYVTIPLPHELRPFYGMGELAFSTLMGKEEPEAALQKAVEGFASLMPFDFTGNAGNAIVNFTPTIAQPLVQLAVNKDYFGTPIYRKTAFNEQDPEWTKAYKSTNQLLVDATEFLNELTGGDEVKNGLIDLNPAVIEHLYEGYLGGMGKTINRAAKTFSMLWDEDARTWRNVPVASSFYQVSDERTSGSQVNREYFDAVDEADAIEHLYSGYRKRAKMGVEEYAEKLNELIESDAFKRYQKVNSYKKAIAKMNTALKEADPTDREDIETRIMELKVDMLEELDAMDIK